MRYGPNFRQELSPEALKKLPKKLSYVGNAEDLKELVGKPFPKAKAETLVYVGERENIRADTKNGPAYPWRGVWITELDDEGNVVTRGYGSSSGAIPERPDNAMTRWELAEKGMTDAGLEKEAKELFGEEHDLSKPGPLVLRQKLFDRVMAAKAK